MIARTDVKASMRKTCFTAALLLTLGAHNASAGSGGSTYSLLGLGDLRYTPGARSIGMGYAGLSLGSSQYINGMSPATWTLIDRTRLEGEALYEGFNSTDGTVSRYLARLDFHGALLAVPVSTEKGIVIVGGFTPYSDVNYDTYTSSTAPGKPDPITGIPDTLNYQIHQSGSGGITRAQLGISWAPFETMALGASFNYLFGTVNNQVQQISQSTGTTGGTFTGIQTFSGIDFTAGVVFTGFGAISEALRPVSLGAVVTTRTNLHTTMQTTYEYLAERDTSESTYGRTSIPFSFGVGLGLKASPRWTLGADYMMQPWSTADFNGATPTDIRNSSRFSVGVERAESHELIASWLERIAYRLGFTYNESYYAPNGKGINEWGVTGGLALPFSGDSHINIALEYGRRGATGSNLVKDKIIRMTISLNISDVWFTRYEEE